MKANIRKSLHATSVFLIACLFGFTVAAIEPYPNTYDLLIFIVASIFFLVMAVLLRKSAFLRLWYVYGLVTFICFFAIFVWYWEGAWKHGWWYPMGHPRIIEQFLFVDGEASYDANVANVFLCCWAVLSTVFGIFAIRKNCHKILYEPVQKTLE